MEPTHDLIERTLDRLVASTRSPRGCYSASNSWKLLEKRIMPRRVRRIRLYRLAGAVAASLLLCLVSWLAYDYRRPPTMQTVSAGPVVSVITLPDQTKVTLNRYSSLTYPERFNRGKREVHLQGEAYFEVEKDSLHPFVVNAGPVEVEVLGTHFNVDAYPDDAEVKTTLLEGSVAVSTSDGNNRVMLSPGESAVYHRTKQTLLEEKSGERMAAIAWCDGHFHFDYQPLQEIARVLSNAFHVKIRIVDEEIKDFRIRAHFTEGETLEQMLDLLRSAGDFSYEKRGNTLLIHSKRK